MNSQASTLSTNSSSTKEKGQHLGHVFCPLCVKIYGQKNFHSVEDTTWYSPFSPLWIKSGILLGDLLKLDHCWFPSWKLPTAGFLWLFFADTDAHVTPSPQSSPPLGGHEPPSEIHRWVNRLIPEKYETPWWWLTVACIPFRHWSVVAASLGIPMPGGSLRCYIYWEGRPIAIAKLIVQFLAFSERRRQNIFSRVNVFCLE